MINNRCFDMNFQKQDTTKDNDNTNMNIAMPGVCPPPVYECPQERCCHREIHHEVKHVIPINTRILNHHIIHHTYVPMYTCCEENDCCNVYDNNCGC